MRISDWSSDVCSSDLTPDRRPPPRGSPRHGRRLRRKGSTEIPSQRSFFLYIANMRAVTAKTPKLLMLAITTAARPSHFAETEPAAALETSKEQILTDEVTLVTISNGVGTAGGTAETSDATTDNPHTEVDTHTYNNTTTTT